MKTVTLFSCFFFLLHAAFASTVTVQPMPPSTICIGTCVTLSAQASGGTAPYTYSWSVNGTPVNSPDCPVITTTYSVIATDHAGIVSSPATVQITVNPPLEIIPIGGNHTVCPGASVALDALASGGNGGPYTYSWTPSTGLSNPNIHNPIASPTSITTYTAIATDNCGTPSDSSYTTIYLYPTTQVSLGTQGTIQCGPYCPLFYASSSPACASSNWNFGDGMAGTGCDSAKHCYTHSGTYVITIHIVDVNGCMGSATLTDTVKLCTGIQNLPSLETTLRSFPNPFSDKINIQCSMPDSHRIIRVFDSLGREVLLSAMPDTTAELDLAFLPKGIYFLQVRSGSELAVRKISRE
jgi:hypothetical protein